MIILKLKCYLLNNLRCETLLGDFLKEISNPQIEQKKYDSMINIILIHCANINGILV
jgi:hypothetical protein